MTRFVICISAVFLQILPCFSLSAKMESIIDGCLNLHAELTAFKSNEEARKKIDEHYSSIKIPKEDSEEGKLIISSLKMTEEEPYKLESDDAKSRNRAFGVQMEKNEKFIEEHKNASKWLYLFTGDVTSYYMTRSVPSTLRHGMRVKKLYEIALEIDPFLTNANINIGNWFFYAPRIFGGGLSKALQKYETANLGARTKGERYMSALVLSQFYFCKKNLKECKRYLLEAEKEVPNSAEIKMVRELNKKGISLFEYNRKKSGVDEHQEEVED